MTISAQLNLGRRLLRALLPEAEKKAEKAAFGWEPMSALGRAQAPYLRIDNIDAVMIYQAPKGGWHGDLMLKQVPDGVPNSLGTPVENPCPTREIAVETMIALLAHIICGERAGTNPAAVALPVFLFHGYEISLLSELLEAIPGYESVEYTHMRLGEMEREVFPDGVPDEHLTLQDDRSRMFMAVVHMAAKTGVFRYPPKEDREPTCDGPQCYGKTTAGIG